MAYNCAVCADDEVTKRIVVFCGVAVRIRSVTAAVSARLSPGVPPPEPSITVRVRIAPGQRVVRQIRRRPVLTRRGGRGSGSGSGSGPVGVAAACRSSGGRTRRLPGLSRCSPRRKLAGAARPARHGRPARVYRVGRARRTCGPRRHWAYKHDLRYGAVEPAAARGK